MNAILKSSFITCLTGFLWLPGLAASNSAPEVARKPVTDCLVEGRCSSVTAETGLNLTIAQWGPFDSDSGNYTMSENNITVSVFQLPGENGILRFQYRIDDPEACPGSTAFNPRITCDQAGETTTTTVRFDARLTNLNCVKSTNNGEYTLTWGSKGCGDEEVIVTLVTDTGKIVQMQVENTGNHTLNPGMDDLRLAYVAPVVSVNGKGDNQAICLNVHSLPAPAMIQSRIYGVFPMNQPVGADVPGPLGPGQVYRVPRVFPFPTNSYRAWCCNRQAKHCSEIGLTGTLRRKREILPHLYEFAENQSCLAPHECKL